MTGLIKLLENVVIEQKKFERIVVVSDISRTAPLAYGGVKQVEKEMFVC